MSSYLILTSEIADQVRESLESTAPIYVPVRRAGGVFILPVSVMEAESHSQLWPILGGCTQREQNDPDFPGPTIVEVD